MPDRLAFHPYMSGVEIVGFKDPANWDESWRVYASDLAANRPGEAQNGEKWYNFDNGNKDLKDLKKMVKELEEVIVALREKKE